MPHSLTKTLAKTVGPERRASITSAGLTHCDRLSNRLTERCTLSSRGSKGGAFCRTTGLEEADRNLDGEIDCPDYRKCSTVVSGSSHVLDTCAGRTERSYAFALRRAVDAFFATPSCRPYGTRSSLTHPRGEDFHRSIPTISCVSRVGATLTLLRDRWQRF